MYNPESFKSRNDEEAFSFMYQFPFATLISVDSELNPVVSHLPLTPQKTDKGFQLFGHLAKANAHWKELRRGSAKIKIIFHGPHTYISPQYYQSQDVPTWNYLALHVCGQAQIIEKSSEIKSTLAVLTEHAEKLWPSGWQFALPEDLNEDNLHQFIVAFRISVTDLNFKKKLSQNRSIEDQLGVMDGLSRRDDDNSRLVMNYMKELHHH